MKRGERGLNRRDDHWLALITLNITVLPLIVLYVSSTSSDHKQNKQNIWRLRRSFFSVTQFTTFHLNELNNP